MENCDTLTTTKEILGRDILSDLASYGSWNASALSDVMEAWIKTGFRNDLVQAALQWLWDRNLVHTDDFETPPVLPRASVVFRTEAGDTFLGEIDDAAKTLPSSLPRPLSTGKSELMKSGVSEQKTASVTSLSKKQQ